MHGQEQQEIGSDRLARIKSLPIWQGRLSIRPLKGGISNESWLVSDAKSTRVVRFGEDYPFHHVGRAHEAMVARAAHQAGFAPELIHSEPGMMVSQFLNARTFDGKMVQDNLVRVAELVKNFHQTMQNHVSGYARLFWVFHVVRDYARTLSEQKSRHKDTLPGLLAIAAALETAQISLPLVYGHNDLLPANFLEADGRLWLIDFEYAGFSTAMFDLAGLSSNAGFTDEQSAQLLETYFGEIPKAPTLKAFDAMQCASLLREAMWSMVSELYLSAPGVDYQVYTAGQLEAFAGKLSAYQSRYGKIASS
jgi:thiamine kinase-like enzyme